jgi:hypothetical protein
MAHAVMCAYGMLSRGLYDQKRRRKSEDQCPAERFQEASVPARETAPELSI